MMIAKIFWLYVTVLNWMLLFSPGLGPPVQLELETNLHEDWCFTIMVKGTGRLINIDS